MMKLFGFFNHGNGVLWGAKYARNPGIQFPSDVACADLDLDGHIDILFTSQLTNSLHWFKNPGNGNFNTAILNTLVTTASAPRIVLGEDIDLNGAPDYVYAARGNDQVGWYQNLNSGFVCDTPSNLSVTNIDFNAATLSWDSVPGADSYLIEGGLGSIPTFDVALTITGTSLNLNTLQDGQTYHWRVSAICDTSTSEASELNVFSTPAIDFTICPGPTSLSVTNITSNTASLNWDPVIQANNYVLRGSVNTFDKTNLVFLSSSSNQVNVSGLAPGTQYFWQVQSICDASSAPVSPFSSVNSFYTLANGSKTEHSSVRIYPNPTNGSFTIIGGLGKTVRIHSEIGQIVFEELSLPDEFINLDLLSGIYFIQISDENYNTIEKIVIRR